MGSQYSAIPMNARLQSRLKLTEQEETEQLEMELELTEQEEKKML